MVQTELHFIFLDLQKAYATVDREQLLKILEWYGVGPNVIGLLKSYWDNQHCVVECGKYDGYVFVLYRCATQGDVVSPTLSNVFVDVVVRKWLADVMDNITAAFSGLQCADIGRMSSLFYADDGAIGSKNHEWLQNATQHLCNLFRDCTSLMPNTEQTETMSCHPGAIRGWCSMQGYKRRLEGTGETYSKRKGKRTVYPLSSCGKDLALESLQSHLPTKHGMDACGSIITKPISLAPRTLSGGGLLLHVNNRNK